MAAGGVVAGGLAGGLLAARSGWMPLLFVALYCGPREAGAAL